MEAAISKKRGVARDRFLESPQAMSAFTVSNNLVGCASAKVEDFIRDVEYDDSNTGKKRYNGVQCTICHEILVGDECHVDY